MRKFAVEHYFPSSRMALSVFLAFAVLGAALLIDGRLEVMAWFEWVALVLFIVFMVIPVYSVCTKPIQWSEMDDKQKYGYGTIKKDILTPKQKEEWLLLEKRYGG